MNKITTLFKGCQDLYTLCGEVCFQKCGILLGGVSDFEELVGGFKGLFKTDLVMSIIV